MIILLSMLLGVLIVLTTILGYIIYICQNKIDIYESWIVEFKNDVNGVYQQLKVIDDKNIFERDDDVGVIFSELFIIIQKLNKRIESNVKDQNKNKNQDQDQDQG